MENYKDVSIYVNGVLVSGVVPFLYKSKQRLPRKLKKAKKKRNKWLQSINWAKFITVKM
jgi:hypothetical protein